MARDFVRLRDRLAPSIIGRAAAPPGLSGVTPADDNQRRAPRKTSRLPGYVKVDGRQRVINCEVLNMSATGARVKVATGDKHIREDVDGFPDQVMLFITYDRLSVNCQIMWRSTEKNEIGVRFLSVPQVY